MYTPPLPLYSPTAWGTGVFLTGKNLNHLETQYSSMKAIIDGHTHDDEIDTKALADSTFFHSSHMGLNSGFDADTLDSFHVSDLLTSILPVGSVIWFKGADNEIPPGWKMCTGQAGTNDWRDRFVIGAGGAYDVGDTLGPATWNGTITPTGTVTIGNHVLTTAELPVHTHTYTEYFPNNVGSQGGAGNDAVRSLASRSSAINMQSEGDGPHGHTGSTASINAIDPRPLYYALYLIKKVS